MYKYWFIDGYRWRKDYGVNLCGRILDWIEINWYESGCKKFVELVIWI